MFSALQPQEISVDVVMNLNYCSRAAPAVDPATVSLNEVESKAKAQESIHEAALEWRRIDPSLNTAVAPLLQKPLVPFQKTEKAKAFKSAIYYSECFLKGITPNDADSAAIHIDSQYNKWWVKSTFHHEEHRAADTKRISRDDDPSISSLKRKYRTNVKGELSSSKRHREGKTTLADVDSALQVLNSDESREMSEVARVSIDEDPDRPIDAFAVHDIPNLSSVSLDQIIGIRDDVIATLKRNGGDVNDPIVVNILSILESYYLTADIDARQVGSDDFPYDADGTWLTLSKPTYSESWGKNRHGELMYSLGRMSFDMFRPTHLQCSIQGIYNTVQLLDAAKGELPYSMPRKLRKELGKSLLEGVKGLRTYNIIVAITIEPNQSMSGKSASESPPEDLISRPIRGIMSNYGYLLPDPHVPNRLSIWFTGGSLEVNDEQQDLGEWKKIFGNAPNRNMSEFARVLAAKILLGATIPDEMEENGTLSYTLKRPIGGHGTAFCDVLYMDDRLRVLRGHGGSIFVFNRCKSTDE